MNDRQKEKIKNNVAGYLLVLPLLISLTIFTIYPLLMALFDSFFLDYNPLREHDWSAFGFGNYIKAFTSKTFWKSIKITTIYDCRVVLYILCVK